MEFIDYSSFPLLANTDYSPTTEAFPFPTSFDKAFIPVPFAASDISLAGFDQYLDQPRLSVEATTSLDVTTSPVTTTATTQLAPPLEPTFNQLNAFPSGLSFDLSATTTDIAAFDPSVSPNSDHSRTPSLCGDGPQETLPATSPPLSPRPQLKRRSTEPAFKIEACPDPANPPKRKRGRPRLDRSTSSLSSNSSAKTRSQRLPHNQVERKYREGLNASLERLRKTVPTLCQEDELAGLLGQPKPSKAMILEGAIEYIKEIEKERDMYRGQIERLRRMGGGWELAGIRSSGFLTGDS